MLPERACFAGQHSLEAQTFDDRLADGCINLLAKLGTHAFADLNVHGRLPPRKSAQLPENQLLLCLTALSSDRLLSGALLLVLSGCTLLVHINNKNQYDES